MLWQHRRTVTLAMALGVGWGACQTLMPGAIGAAIDAGVSARDPGALLGWTLAFFALGVGQAVAGILRHRVTVFNWLSSAYRTIQLTVRQATRLGATLPKRVATGEVVSIGVADIAHIGNAIDIMARGAGAVASLILVVVLLLHASVRLGVVVLIGVPVMMGLVGLLIRPLHRRQHAYREQQSTLATRAADIVTGLRVLRGVGGEETFSARYRDESQQVATAGIRVAATESLLDAAHILLPGCCVVMVTWFGARFAVAGEMTIGQLVACYGYAVFLMLPLGTLTELVDKVIRGHVAARRVVRLLSLRSEVEDSAAATPSAPVPAQLNPHGASLADPESGLLIQPGRLTALVAAEPAEATVIADRLGRYRDSAARLGGVPLAQLKLATVRELIMVADNDARLFTGELRAELSGGRQLPDERVDAALHAASAQDIVASLPDGLDATVAERGREFSGGQQQRLRLVRALLADPPVLILVEPTSAVDAHTEARVAERLAGYRSGRTTVVCTSSPLVLDRVDHVVYVEGGHVVAEGAHRGLLETVPGYAATVTRGEG